MANPYAAGGWLPAGILGPSALTGPVYVGPSGTPAPSAPGKVAEFSGLPFDLAIGEIYGLRVWKVDKYGRLRARHVEAAKPWRPGINTAECLAQLSYVDPTGRGRPVVRLDMETQSGRLSYRYLFADGTTCVTGDPPGSNKNERPVPDEACKCGFYAYTEPEHVELQMKNAERLVLGVAKGTGRTLLGHQGFRSEKAEIVALLNPAGVGEGPTSSKGKEMAAQIARVYPDVPLLPTKQTLLEFAPVKSLLPEPGSDEFWELP